MHTWIPVAECACPPRSIVEVLLLFSSSRKDDLALCCRFSDRYCYSNSDVMCHVTRYCNMIGHGLYTFFPYIFYRSGSGSWDQHACRYKPISQLTCISVGKSGHCSYAPWWRNQQFCHWSHPQHRQEWLQKEPVFHSDLYGASHQSNCNIRNRIGLSMNGGLPSCMIFWSNSFESSTNAHLWAADTLGTQKPSHHPPTISWPHLWWSNSTSAHAYNQPISLFSGCYQFVLHPPEWYKQTCGGGVNTNCKTSTSGY